MQTAKVLRNNKIITIVSVIWGLGLLSNFLIADKSNPLIYFIPCSFCRAETMTFFRLVNGLLVAICFLIGTGLFRAKRQLGWLILIALAFIQSLLFSFVGIFVLLTLEFWVFTMVFLTFALIFMLMSIHLLNIENRQYFKNANYFGKGFKLGKVLNPLLILVIFALLLAGEFLFSMSFLIDVLAEFFRMVGETGRGIIQFFDRMLHPYGR